MNKSRNIPIGALIGLLAVAFVVSGCPERGVEGDPGNPDINGPQRIINYSARAFFDRVELHWEFPTKNDSVYNRDLMGVMIVRSVDQQPLALPYRNMDYEVGDFLGRGEVVYIGGEEGFVDDQVDTGQTYYYEAFTFDEIPNYGDSALLNATPGSMIRARLAHTQTLLLDGTVLLVGGIGYEGPLDDAEIYDPDQGVFVELVPQMRKTRFDHTATLLSDGRVLIVGGFEEGFLETLRTAEIFDPATQTFAWVEDTMVVGRASHTATLLDDGTVLIVGGSDGINGFSTAEIFDPQDETFTPLANEMLRDRYDQTATLVTIDAAPFVLVTGGFDGFNTVAYATFFDPDTRTFGNRNGELAAEDPLAKGRLAHTATTLLDGRVLVAGGFVGTLESGDPTVVSELFDPLFADPFTLTGELIDARSGHTAALLPDGSVLIAGGIDGAMDILDSAEMYDADAGLFHQIAPLNFKRTVPVSTVLPDGTVLISGGNDSSLLFDPEPVSTAELFDPATESFSVVGR